MSWQVIEVESAHPDHTACEFVRVVHVVPTHGPTHCLLGDECGCEPTLERQDNGNFLVVHRDLN